MKPFDLFNFNPGKSRRKDDSEEQELKRLFPLPDNLEVACQKMEYMEGQSPRDLLRLAIYDRSFWNYIMTRENRQKPSLRQDLVGELRQVAYSLGHYDPDIALVILYGSLDKGNWNPQGSDVDLAVVTRSSRYALGSPELSHLRYAVHSATERPGLYSVHVVSPSNLINEALRNDGRGNNLRAILSGRAIYERPKVLI